MGIMRNWLKQLWCGMFDHGGVRKDKCGRWWCKKCGKEIDMYKPWHLD